MSFLPLSAPLSPLSDSWIPQLISLPCGPHTSALSPTSSTKATHATPAAHGNPRRCARAHPRPGHSRYRGRARRRPSAPVAAGAEYAVARPPAPPGEARRPGLRSAAVGLLIRKHRPNPNPSSPPCSASPRGRSPSSWSRLHPWPPDRAAHRRGPPSRRRRREGQVCLVKGAGAAAEEAVTAPSAPCSRTTRTTSSSCT